MSRASLLHKTGACLALALLMSGCQGCPPSVTLKTLELKPTTMTTGRSGFAGSMGWCLHAGHPPPSAFSAGPGQVMVGFDNFFSAGTPPFPCDDLRAVVFRAGIRFDVSQFDQVVSAELLLDTVQSISRAGGELVGTSPPTSHATAVGVAVGPFTGQMPYDTEAPLTPASGNVNVAVLTQVRAWIDKTHSNFGFVVAGPTGLADPSNPPKNNDAEISWYSNVRLRVGYNPGQNPRAPQ
jgi:hypothetical protein